MIMKYEISSGTLAIMPTDDNNSLVYEDEERYVVNEKPFNIMDASCRYFGSSYEGRKEGAKAIKGEFASNGVKNDLKHTRGVISMARSMDPNSAGSQFFIMHQNAPHLDGQYAAFGKVIEGMDVVDEIANIETNYMDRPLVPQQIKTIEII